MFLCQKSKEENILTNIILSGCNGKMGQVISRLVADMEDVNIAFGYDINTEKKWDYEVYSDFGAAPSDGDVVIDFSHPASFDSIVAFCRKTNTPLVMATTGLSAEQKETLNELSKEEYGMVLRAKGIVASKGDEWIHFDYVPGEADVRFGCPSVIGRICVIGSNINEEKISELF